MAISNRFKDLPDFLRGHTIKKGETDEDKIITHTRIGNRALKIAGGCYNISKEDRSEFYHHYYNHIYQKKKLEYLTETQVDNGPIVIDLDFRYAANVKSKQHGEEHIVDLLAIYFECINGMLEITEEPIPVYIFEKQKVNTDNEKYTKDGIHIMIGIKMDHVLQTMLRVKVLREVGSIWDLPIINEWSDVFDEGISKGHTKWQLYGSRKPGNDSYILKTYYRYTLDKTDNEFMCEKKYLSIDGPEILEKLSVQSEDFVEFEISGKIRKEYDELVKERGIKKSRSSSGRKINFIQKATNWDIDNIKDDKTLDEAISVLHEMLKESIDDYYIKEVHAYTMILGKKYWGPGSYDYWIRLGMALKNSDKENKNRFLLTWIKASSKSDDFSYDSIGEMIEKWSAFVYNPNDGLTERSIIWWAKNENKMEWDKVHELTVDYYIENTISDQTEFDLAMVLFQMYKDKFVCSSIKNNTWWEFQSNRWVETDCGNSLRKAISTKMHQKYIMKTQQFVHKLQSIMEESNSSTGNNPEADAQINSYKKKASKIVDICSNLKKTNNKNNVMREAREIFYNKDFINKLDSNTNLLCFTNGVIDFKEKTFRKGHPEDYISKSTNIKYEVLNKKRDSKIIDEIEEFMRQLFPIPELYKYMWDHFASCLIGTNQNQTFNIYTGSGRNGKSKLVELMSMILGEYKGTVPITLITQKRNSIGSTSSEIVQLMGTRYAVMQEPSKGDHINEGIMKEITGGDPIQGRALFKDTVTFVPQFKLVVCTNTMFDIKSNDDGTWRRIRVCDFKSKFTENPVTGDPDEPYQYKVDKSIEKKFESWKLVFMSMLVDRAFETQGNVEDCDIVMAKSMNYREGQDYLTEFVKEKIVPKDGCKVKKTELYETFKQWYTMQYGRGVPKGKELYDFMIKRYGKYKAGWHNIKINYDEDSSEDEEELAV